MCTCSTEIVHMLNYSVNIFKWSVHMLYWKCAHAWLEDWQMRSFNLWTQMCMSYKVQDTGFNWKGARHRFQLKRINKLLQCNISDKKWMMTMQKLNLLTWSSPRENSDLYLLYNSSQSQEADPQWCICGKYLN